MSSYKVSYGRCARKTFLKKKNAGTLVPGRLYYIKDSGEIFRADSTNTYEQYSDKIHIVSDWPDNTEDNHWIPNNIYIKPLTGSSECRAKIAIGEWPNQVIYEVRCDNSGGGGGGGSDSGAITELRADVANLKADVATIKEQLKWKDSNNA